MGNLYIDTLSGEEFENYLLSLFKNLGYDGYVTQASNDYGADLVISKDDKIIVIQAKRYKDTVGITAIQEVIGSKNYYNATKCMVVTNNYFTPNAVKLAEHNDVELWDRDVLIKMAVLSVDPKCNNRTIETINKPENTIVEEIDPLFSEAIQLVFEEGQISISILQLKLKVGYARAARIIDQMESHGIISGYNGSVPRKLLISKKDLENMHFDINSKSLSKQKKKGLFGLLFKK